jgi:hypothetical protein
MDTTTWKEELQLFENEVEYRLAKWIFAGMLQDGIISDSKMQKVWEKIAEHCTPSFLEVIFFRRLIQCSAYESVEKGLKQRLSADFEVLPKAIFYYVSM